MKKILFLGAAYSQLPAIKYARKKGLYIITVDYLPDNPGHKLSDEYYNISTIDKESILELALKLKIDAISAYASDPAALTAAYVSSRLGLVGNLFESVSILSSKTLFRKFLKDNNFLYPLYFSGYSVDELLKRYTSGKYVIKPIDSSGSKGVNIVADKNDIIRFFGDAEKFSRSGEVIMEQFIERKGPQIHGEGFVVDGMLRFLYLGDQYFDVDKKLIPFSTIVPSIEHEDIMEEAFKLVSSFIQKLGFKNGGINVEIIRDKNNNLFLLEIGARSGGNFMPQLIKYATKVDLVKANIDVLFNQKINFEPRINERFHYAQIILHTKNDGVLKGFTTPKELNEILMQKMYYKQGDKLKKYKSSRDVVGVNILKISDKDLKIKNYQNLLFSHEFLLVE